jgi:hypothetical protein
MREVLSPQNFSKGTELVTNLKRKRRKKRRNPPQNVSNPTKLVG